MPKIIKHLYKGKKGDVMEASRGLRVRGRLEDAGLPALRVEEGTMTKESRWPQEAGKGRETNFPLDTTEEMQLQQPFGTSDPRTVR